MGRVEGLKEQEYATLYVTRSLIHFLIFILP